MQPAQFVLKLTSDVYLNGLGQTGDWSVLFLNVETKGPRNCPLLELNPDAVTDPVSPLHIIYLSAFMSTLSEFPLVPPVVVNRPSIIPGFDVIPGAEIFDNLTVFPI